MTYNKNKYDVKNKRYDIELQKFLGSPCEVVDTFGNKHQGVCLGVNLLHLNVVLMTATEKIIIKNISSMRRQRVPDPEVKGDTNEKG